MRVEKLGEGEPEITVVGSLHGDEPCGKKAIERFLSENWEIREPVRFIIGNEKALKNDGRFMEEDLNRIFGKKSDRNTHEARLAPRIAKRVNGTEMLDIHSTRSFSEPFCTFHDLTGRAKELLSHIDVKYAVHFPEGNGTLKTQASPGIVLESGLQGTQEASENANRKLLNFLAVQGVIERETVSSEPEFFQIFDTVKGRDWEFRSENFSLVEKGEVYAEKPGGEKLRAGEDFYLVLMSTNGYSQILGHKARKIQPEEI